MQKLKFNLLALILAAIFLPQAVLANECNTCHTGIGSSSVHHQYSMQMGFLPCTTCHTQMLGGIYMIPGGVCESCHANRNCTPPAPANSAPTIDPIGNQSVAEGSVLSFAINAQDSDNNLSSLTMATNAPGALLNGNVLTILPGYGDAGNYTATFTATDTLGLTATETITITVGNVNRPPILATVPVQISWEGMPLSIIFSASDPDGDAIAYAVTNLPGGAHLDGNIITWTPDYMQAGTYQLTVSATDSGYPPLTATQTITVTISNVNRQPVFFDIPNQTASEGLPYELILLASDPDGDLLAYSAENLPAGATIDGNVISWIPDYSQAGTYQFEAAVSDGDKVDAKVITISVGNVNRPPAFQAVSPVNLLEGETVSISSITANDPDGDSIALIATGLPEGASFDATNGILNWTTDQADAGNYTVTITATDDGIPPATAQYGIVINVGDVPTVTEMSTMLSADTESLANIGLSGSLVDSLVQNADKVAPFVTSGKTGAATGQLTAYISKLNNSLTSSGVTPEQTAAIIQLIQVATKIRADLNP